MGGKLRVHLISIFPGPVFSANQKHIDLAYLPTIVPSVLFPVFKKPQKHSHLPWMRYITDACAFALQIIHSDTRPLLASP